MEKENENRDIFLTAFVMIKADRNSYQTSVRILDQTSLLQYWSSQCSVCGIQGSLIVYRILYVSEKIWKNIFLFHRINPLLSEAS